MSIVYYYHMPYNMHILKQDERTGGLLDACGGLIRAVGF